VPSSRTKYPAGHPRHSKGRIYGAWRKMLERCEDPNHDAYPWYGGRGIRVCERWHHFERFAEDMGEHPGPGFSLDRIDSDGPYEPGNCRWSDNFTQRQNRRNVHRIGDEPAVVVARRAGVNAKTVTERLRRGEPVERALSKVPLLTKDYCHLGHPRFGENLHVRGDGRRECRACMRISNQKQNEKKRRNA
jgi:hypothetical protein